MEYRKFGNTGLVVSEIGFGAWAIGGGAMVGNTAIGWGSSNDVVSSDAICAALEAGVTFFDTADIYGLGHSEDLLGKTLREEMNVVIATKVGNVSRNGTFTTDYTKAHILDACERSLKRLHRETIDYYQLHTARLEHLQKGECVEAMELLKKQGKIRYWGLSLNTFEPAAEAAYCMENGLGNGFQLVLNLVNQNALPLVAEAAANGYGVIARMPLQFGLLTGKFDTTTTFAHNDHRQKRLTPEVIERSSEALAPVWDLCSKYGCTKTALAISFILSYPGISTVIPGIRNRLQVVHNTGGFVKLEAPDQKFLEDLGEGPLAELLRLIREQG